MNAKDLAEKVPCEECPLRSRECFRDFSEAELKFVRNFKQGELTIGPGAPIVLEDANSPHLFTVLKGWAFRYKTLSDGRRQILNYVLPGDLIGLQSSVFDQMSHGIEALTDMLLCVFPRDKVWSLYSRQPSLAFDITWLAAREERLLDEHLLTVGRRTALERVAYVIWHLHERANAVGMADGGAFEMPLTQQHLADTLGLSLVHTNKTLKKLRGQGCIDWSDGILRVRDRDALMDTAKAEDLADGPRPFI